MVGQRGQPSASLVSRRASSLSLGLGERLEGGVDRLSPLAAEAAHDRRALVGEGDARATGVVGIRLAADEAQLDDLLHEARRPGLIDTDRFADLAHGEGAGCRGQRVEQPKPRRSADAPAGEPGRRTSVRVVVTVVRAAMPPGGSP